MRTSFFGFPRTGFRMVAVALSVMVFTGLCGSAQDTDPDKIPGVLEPYTFILESFESEDSLLRWGFDGPSAKPKRGCMARLSTDWATHGRRSLRLTFLKGGEWPAMHTDRGHVERWPDFAEYEIVEIDFFNPHEHPAPGPGSAAQGLVFHYSGSTHQSKEARLQAGQVRHWRLSIWDELAVSKRGEPLDVSLIDSFHFYAWNPVRDYTRHIDNIRLSRDLGSRFRQLKGALDLLDSAGAPAERLQRLRQGIDEKQAHFAAMPFSKDTFAAARETLGRLETDVGQAEIILPSFQARISALLSRRRWSADTRREFGVLQADIQAVRQRLAELPMAANRYEDMVLEGVRRELQLIESAVTNAGKVLPWASTESDMVVGWQHASTFVKPYGQVFTGGFDRASIAGARGEIVGVQVVVFALDADVSARLSIQDDPPESLPAAAVRLHAQGFINLGPATEAGSAAHRLQWHPDILYPLPAAGFPIAAGTPAPFLLEIEVPRTMPAGLYSLGVRVASESGDTVLPLDLRVYDFEMPRRFTLKTTMGSRNTQDGPLLVRFGLDPGAIYGSWAKPWRDAVWRETHRKGEGKVAATQERLEYEQFVVEQYQRGQQRFNMLNLKGLALSYARRQWAFKGDDMEENWSRLIATYDAFLTRMAALGVPRECFYVYGFDERGPGHADTVREFTRRFNEGLGLSLMATPLGTGWLEKPVDTMNWWCGALGSGETRRRRIAEIHEAGGQAWWYDNNMGFVPDLWVSRHKGWYARHWDMDGYLIYSGHAWSNGQAKALDPETLPYSNWHEPSLGVHSACGLTYYQRWESGPEERYPSFRLWNLRAGLYDYEYLDQLDEHVAKAARVSLDARYQPILVRARQLAAVPDYVVTVPRTIDQVSGASIAVPVAGADAAAGMRVVRSEAAEIIEILGAACRAAADEQ